jgi:hypothetical protein
MVTCPFDFRLRRSSTTAAQKSHEVQPRGSGVGKAKSTARFNARQLEHDFEKNVEHNYKILGKAKPGQQLDVLEETWIRKLGGPTNKSNPNGRLENKRFQMSDKRYRAAGGTQEK